MSGVSPELQPVIENLLAAQAKLEQVVGRVEPARWQDPSGNAGWTHKDLLAHLSTGDWVCQYLLRALLEAGSVPDWPDVDAGNAERIAARRDEPVSALMEERASHRWETIGLIERLQPSHLEKPIDMPWMGLRGLPFLRYLQGFAAHDIGHTRELEAIAGKRQM